jgi:hypothetical protein
VVSMESCVHFLASEEIVCCSVNLNSGTQSPGVNDKANAGALTTHRSNHTPTPPKHNITEHSPIKPMPMIPILLMPGVVAMPRTWLRMAVEALRENIIVQLGDMQLSIKMKGGGLECVCVCVCVRVCTAVLSMWLVLHGFGWVVGVGHCGGDLLVGKRTVVR